MNFLSNLNVLYPSTKQKQFKISATDQLSFKLTQVYYFLESVLTQSYTCSYELTNQTVAIVFPKLTCESIPAVSIP